MKFAIVGYSGSGKSTLARELAKKYQTDVLHFDAVHFLPDWKIRSDEEKKENNGKLFKYTRFLGH